MILMIVMLLFSFAVMITGAELLVLGASRLATMLGISQLIIGLTIVSFGTSAPELVVSIKGVLTGHSDLVVGNCIGSNIFNVLFIIGACAAVAPLVVTQQLVKIDVPIMIGAHFLFLLVSFNGVIDRVGALILLASFSLYYGYVIFKSRKENASLYKRDDSVAAKNNTVLPAIFKQAAFITVGLILCITGAGWVVEIAVNLARTLGISELVIGLTIVSIGTSLPEVATSIVATIRGQRDIAIGNVVGSCIFNILGIIGLASLMAPQGLVVAPAVLRFDLPVAIVTSIACLPIFFTDYKISRWEGLLFLFYYAAYISYLLLESHQHDALPMFSMAMLWFVVPLTALTLGIISYRAIRSK